LGAAQDLAALDIDLAAITQTGGWNSTRMPLQYAQKINAARSGMARAAEESGRDSALRALHRTEATNSRGWILLRLLERVADLCCPDLVSMVTAEIRSYGRMPRSRVLLRGWMSDGLLASKWPVRSLQFRVDHGRVPFVPVAADTLTGEHRQ